MKKGKHNLRWTRTPLWLTAWLLAGCMATSLLIAYGFYISLCVSIPLTLAGAWAVCRYMERTSRLMEHFIRSVRYSEFPESFTPGGTSGLDGLPPELPARMQEALDSYRNNLQRKEGRLLYFQALANHIDIAVLVYTPDGSLEWLNEAASRLLALSTDEKRPETHVLRAPRTVDDLQYLHPDAPRLLRMLKPGDLHVWQVRQPHEEEPAQVAVSGMEFALQGRRLLIASLKNIHSALDSQETLAWQKLIRVLTHEIMNSVTPVISLAGLLETQIGQLEGDADTKEDMRQMLRTIARRGNALTRFVSNYREVSHLPMPQLLPHRAADILKDAERLMQSPDKDLEVVLPPSSLRLIADKGQVEQVLINLIKNARENEARHITLSAGLSSGGRLYLRVADDGTGIEPDVQERIFIPFFTTKPDGSGIGLTLARQIMHQHNGNILVKSRPGEGSTFTLLFPYG